MESSYSIESDHNLVRLEIWGEVTVAGLTAALLLLAADPRYRAGMNGVVDFREAHAQWDYTEIQRFRDFVVQRRSVERPTCRWAALARPGDLAAAGHVMIVISEPMDPTLEMELFEDPVSALRWINARKDAVSG